jgi:hypothetical protein
LLSLAGSSTVRPRSLKQLPALHDAYPLAAQRQIRERCSQNVTDLPPTSLIAIDAMQFGSVDPRIPQFVTALIDHTKQRVRWIVSWRSRHDLPIDVVDPRTR